MKKKKSVRPSPTSNPPVIALITDFGLEDHYVGTMKAVILSINPKANIVDITHQVMSQQVQQAGYLLWSAYKYFPKSTLFAVIVDPGVGSQRRIVGVRSSHHTFLAPENGVLNLVLSEIQVRETVEIDVRKAGKFLPPNISSTFHGRDIFAPVAGYLSKGKSLQAFGKKTTLNDVQTPFVKRKSSAVKPSILHIDHFGNLVTNILSQGNSPHEIQTVAVGKGLVSRWIRNYEEAPDRTPCLIVGSSGLIEIVVKKDHAARLLGASVSAPVTVCWV